VALGLLASLDLSDVKRKIIPELFDRPHASPRDRHEFITNLAARLGQPNAGPELLPEAGARDERTLEAVSSWPMLGFVPRASCFT
jgi:hypothetical protein